MKFQQAAVYTSNSNLSRVERSGLPSKRVQSSYMRNKSKLSGVFQENLVPENSVCSKILIKEKILCCPENSNSAYNNLCFEDCPNLIILKKHEKDLKDLIESNLNLKKMNEYLLKTISIKDDLFIDVTKEVKNLKVDNNILNAHIGSKRILSGRQCQIRQSFKNSLASGITDNMQKPSSCSFNPKFASQSIISSSTLNNFYSGYGNFINKKKENYKSNFISNLDSISGSAIKKKRSDSVSNGKEVHVRGVSGFSRTNNLNTFLNLAPQQKRKNSEARSNNNINNTNKKGVVVEFVNNISSKVSNVNCNQDMKNPEFCGLGLIKTNLNLNNNNNYNVNNSNNNNLNQNYNSSSKVNLNLKNNEDKKNDVANSNRNNKNNQGFSVLATARFSPGSLTSKLTSLDLSPNKPQNSASSDTSDLNNENQNDNLNNNNNNNNNDNNNYFKSIIKNNSPSKKTITTYKQNQSNNKAQRKQSYYNSDNYNNNNITSSCANSSFAGHTKPNNFYDQISNLVSKNNQKNLKFKNKARSSLLGLNDEMLSKIITNEVISNLKKITLNDEEFIDFFRTTGEDKLISYCDAIYQLIRDVESAIKLIQRMRDYIIITASLANCALIEEIAAFIIKDACKIMDCDRTSIFIYDNLSDMLVVHTGEGLNRNEIRVPKNLGIIGNVFLKAEIIRVDDAYSDSRFNKDFDSKSNYVTKTILAAPLKDSSGKPFGVIQSINKNNNAKFTDDDEELIHLFSLHISQIMKSAKTNDQNISYIAKLKMIIAFKEDVLRIESLVDFSNCIEQAIMNIFSTQYSQILIFNELKNNLVKISKYEKSEKNKNIGIVGYVFKKKEYFGVNSCNGCEFYNNLVDIETGMSILTYPIINKGNVKAILQFSYNDKLIHFKKPKETDEQIIKYLLLDCENWFVKNEENVKSFFGE